MTGITLRSNKEAEQYVGTVEAADAKAAIRTAVHQFEIRDRDAVRRLSAQPETNDSPESAPTAVTVGMRWTITLRSRKGVETYVGVVEAADEKAAIRAAVIWFNIRDADVPRLSAWPETGSGPPRAA
jgi:1,2-phenylacetyl-CoA epoxidase PaaB subunit